MTALAILASVSAIVVALIVIWSTDTLSGQRLKAQRGFRYRRERRELRTRLESFCSEPALVEFEARFDELADAYEANWMPHNLRVLWAEVFRLAGESPVGPPFQYGVLEVH